ncbi:serine/threonine-protein kinase [Brasilonema bromeliae]|uniref:non-specific serine/threonine protein kinase n=1 Tax=Brasilonema bromeliae SPC951 TaxID=385972 RepID=A0ABX1P288_9CYAN|nr:serine/threonine-protein kinase [Brasilonema bromeliae]NMG18444.1 serine/threonine protein kinase [Brasilonema bromeliae SPC951]
MLGQTICGRYRIIRQIGKGGFGVTFLAEDTQRPGNPQCVVKQLKPQSDDSYTLHHAKRFFDQEAEILEILGNHDQIPRLLAHCTENQEFYIVQEYIKGQDLNQEVFSKRQLSEAEVIKLLKQILEVLAFVHQKRVIHRDLKPSNIMRRESDGKIVLIDFGAVKQVTTQIANPQGETQFTVAIGTPGYVASEQANGKPTLSSDIYALGVICIQALTGIHPDPRRRGFPTDSKTGEIIWRNQAQVSPKLANIIDKMVRYDYRQRYQSADEALEALKTLLPKKFLIGSGIAAVLAISLPAISIFKPPTPESFLQYENSNFGIKIKYPQSWQRQDINNPVTKEVVAFVSPQQSDVDKFKEKVIISVEEFSGTLDEFSKSSVQEIKKNTPDANVSTSETSFANKLGKELVFPGKTGENSLQNLQVFTLKGDKAYVITYTAEKDNYDEFLKTVEKMIKSFEIQ